MDVMKALKSMPDESVDMQITSPPYWGLRDYGEGTETIWDGKKNCKHDFKIKKRKLHSGSTKKDWVKDMSRGIRKTAGEWETSDGFCNKCGAWKGQLGLEPTFDLYIKHLADVFDKVMRVLKKEGTCWVNLGDTYSSGNRKGNAPDKLGGGRDGLNSPNRNNCGIVDKCLVCIPERFIIEMISRGWILRNKIIWHKPNHMPTSVKDRFACSWEYLFMFSKSKKYYFDLDAVRELHKNVSLNRSKAEAPMSSYGTDKIKNIENARQIYGNQNMKLNQKGKNPDDVIQDRMQYLISKLYDIKKDIRDEKISYLGKSKDLSQYNNALANAKAFRNGLIILKKQENLSEEELKFLRDYVQNHFGHPKGKNPGDYWNITTRGYPEAHFAVFPEKLVERPIKTTKKDAIIMDIFAGSGTTLLVAREFHRDSIGIEIKSDYVKLIKKRLIYDKKGNRNLYPEPEVIK